MSEPEMQANLSLQDIEMSIRLIDMVSQRGAIRGEELAQVGTLRERLVNFLRAATPKQPDAEPAPEAPEASE